MGGDAIAEWPNAPQNECEPTFETGQDKEDERNNLTKTIEKQDLHK